MSTLRIHAFMTRTYFTFAFFLINTDGRTAAIRVELFIRPFLPLPCVTPPTRKGLGIKVAIGGGQISSTECIVG